MVTGRVIFEHVPSLANASGVLVLLAPAQGSVVPGALVCLNNRWSPDRKLIGVVTSVVLDEVTILWVEP